MEGVTSSDSPQLFSRNQPTHLQEAARGFHLRLCPQLHPCSDLTCLLTRVFISGSRLALTSKTWFSHSHWILLLFLGQRLVLALQVHPIFNEALQERPGPLGLHYTILPDLQMWQFSYIGLWHPCSATTVHGHKLPHFLSSLGKETQKDNSNRAAKGGWLLRSEKTPQIWQPMIFLNNLCKWTIPYT